MTWAPAMTFPVPVVSARRLIPVAGIPVAGELRIRLQLQFRENWVTEAKVKDDLAFQSR